MYAYIEERVMNVAEYIVEHEATVRAAASKFGISKSTVHHDMQVRKKGIDADRSEEHTSEPRRYGNIYQI